MRRSPPTLLLATCIGSSIGIARAVQDLEIRPKGIVMLGDYAHCTDVEIELSEHDKTLLAKAQAKRNRKDRK